MRTNVRSDVPPVVRRLIVGEWPLPHRVATAFDVLARCQMPERAVRTPVIVIVAPGVEELLRVIAALNSGDSTWGRQPCRDPGPGVRRSLGALGSRFATFRCRKLAPIARGPAGVAVWPAAGPATASARASTQNRVTVPHRVCASVLRFPVRSVRRPNARRPARCGRGTCRT